jgi:hypothetical protein
MGKRGENTFKRNDGLRAVKIARDSGIEPTMLEIVAKDGTIFRVHGNKAVPDDTREVMTSAEWDAEIAKLKAKTKGR